MIKLAVLAFFLLMLPAFAQECAYPVAIDGDTIACGEERIRVIGLDTPETYQSQCKEELLLGYTAQGRLQHILNSNDVSIKRTGKTDKYGRTLATLYVGARQVDVAKILVQEGLARAYDGRSKRQSWCSGASSSGRAFERGGFIPSGQ